MSANRSLPPRRTSASCPKDGADFPRRTPATTSSSSRASGRAQEAAALAQRQVGQVRQAASAVLESYRSAGGDDRRGSVRIDRSPGSVAVGGSVAGSTVSTKVSIVNDYDSIIDLLKRHRVDYLNEIVDYLGPVRDHLAGGGTRRTDALERWAWFAAQAAGALSGIDGLLGLVDRVGRALGR